MQTLPKILKCHFCSAKPQHFTILLCNHIICSNCLPNHQTQSAKTISILCLCGVMTYFSEDQYPIKSTLTISDKHTNQNKYQQLYANNSFRDSQINSKLSYKISPRKTMYKVNNLFNQLNKNHRNSQRRLKTEQNSKKYHQQSFYISPKNQQFSFQSISVPRKSKEHQSQSMTSIKQFNSTLKLIEVQYIKTVEELNQNYQKILKSVDKEFAQMTQQFKQLFLTNTVNTSDLSFNITFLRNIKIKYQKQIDKRLINLNDIFYQFLTDKKGSFNTKQNQGNSYLNKLSEQKSQFSKQFQIKQNPPTPICTYHKSKLINQYNKFMDKISQKKKLQKKGIAYNKILNNFSFD